MPSPSLVPVEEMVARLERALAGSPADETEMVWIEARRGQESHGKRRRDGELAERTLLVRVRESGRIGLHRTGEASLADLDKAVREALAQARLGAPAPPPLLPAGARGPLPTLPALADPELARMTPARARDLIQRNAERGEVALLGWAEGRYAVVDSRGLRRAAEVTAAWTAVSCGRTPGAGRAAAAARSLAGLDAPAVFARARRRSAAGDPAEVPQGAVPVVLAPEAAAVLLDLLARHALSSLAFHDGVSFLRERTGQELFHPDLTLRDDATDPRGLPFPFDFLGAAKRPLPLIERGVFLGPVRDERLARAGGAAPTPHLVAPDEARAANLFLQPAEVADAALLARAEGGVWVADLDPVEAFDRRALRFRAIARGARRIAAGAPGPALPDLLWEDSLPALLSRILGVGLETVTVATGDPLLGAVTTPMLAFAGVTALRPVPAAG